MAAWSVLTEHQLFVGPPSISVSVHEAGKSNSHLFQGRLRPDVATGASDAASRLAEQVEAALAPGDIGAVHAEAEGIGAVVTGDRATREERLFLLGASAVLDYVSTELVTFSDAWMPYDLKGQPQAAVHKANAPRLSAALQALSGTLDSEIDPDEATCFAKPTEFGVDNYLEDDGTASDVWSSFEVPYRYSKFTHAPGFGRIGYKRSTEGPVYYVPVLGSHGVLGYLWASDAGEAASFEPRDVSDDESYKTGLMWLDRLRDAHDQGLSPTEALTELTSGLEPGKPQTIELAALREMTHEN
ncbi:hypothetical protein [Streptomyces sp. DvalAA-19]|uniref:hypothetical protein n=1 Tax=Streptomyces sp. DvalAA-19 TaxID=1839761 RepID=UPI000AA9B3ED|nr:hypothetical protein [Streptomyces sp. DvalAA-19]